MAITKQIYGGAWSINECPGEDLCESAVCQHVQWFTTEWPNWPLVSTNAEATGTALSFSMNWSSHLLP